jgi:hypothetical protein
MVWLWPFSTISHNMSTASNAENILNIQSWKIFSQAKPEKKSAQE